MSDEKERTTLNLDKRAKEVVTRRHGRGAVTEICNEALRKEAFGKTKNEIESLKQYIDELKEEREQAQSTKQEADERVEEISEQIGDAERKLQQILEEQQTYEEKIEQTASEHDRLARDHSIIESLAHEYDRDKSEIRADLEERGCDTYEVEL